MTSKKNHSSLNSSTQSRRSFLKAGALITGTIIAGNFSGSLSKAADFINDESIDISVVKGDDYYRNTIKAVDALGGMNRFISKGSTAGLLINSRYNKPGTYVKPEIAIAALTMLLDAGVKKIISLERVAQSYWQLSPFSKKHMEKIKEIKQAEENFEEVSIKGAVALKKAEVIKEFLECDAYINIPIFKEHEGIRKTGNLKNLMGLTSYSTNRFFHFGSNASDWYSDPAFLSQCIADVNLIKKPSLCICDATEYIVTNGPFGPGEVVKSREIVAGVDRVAVDAYGAQILGYKPNDILPIKMAAQHGMGEIDLKKVKIKEIAA
ncbi:MAG TPA: DUF362 domain-containing protein [Ignavibacteriaceae bacterium]|nr:DUF362 domain-containing protein [Ignavibacteriaceae bacterium]